MVAIPLTKAERMRAAVAAHAVASAPVTPPPAAPSARDDLPPIREILRGDWHHTPHGPAFVREEWLPLGHRHGRLDLGAPLSACPGALSALARGDAPHPSRLGFFDIETTGLSGGTGTYIVLAGFGWFEEGAFRLRQYFLADIGAERAMLSLLAEDMARVDGVVTYNGKAFDLPITESRFALARLRSPAATLSHIDLLHAVRRLYKHRMPGCRLAEAEHRLLKLDRPDDIPGSLIPTLYFDYVRAGRAAPLRAVFAHNADDVLSMVGILASLAVLLAGSELEPEDAVAVARWWERSGDEARAMSLYRGALPWLEGEDDWAWAAARHAQLCRRAGIRDESSLIWARLWQNGDLRAGLELAKHLEHHDRDFRAAEGVTLALLARCPTSETSALEHRLTRIRSRMQRVA
jgi:uncharacterized protein YprB with RNaseH-like and TPR domain